ncbi:uncharacterized protein LOC143343247 [Colletes latitarsis]|uniref:uncharacterized protein LOC143343247 n=1 Tax=Colletes latitarsis TaxID=2605962 RepID=UPI004035B793
MHNNFKTVRPPIPQTWGSENASPTRSYELLSEGQSIIFQPEHCTASDSTVGLSPTEEYLQMTKRLIEINALPPRVITILKHLYDRYKSIQGYGPATWDTETDSLLLIFAETREEKPSTSDKPDQSKKGRAIRISELEVEQRYFELQTVQDLSLEHHCDSEVFAINNVFSNFSLREAGYEKTLKKRLTRRITKQTDEFSGSNPNGSGQNTTSVDVNQETEATANGRLRKVRYNQGLHLFIRKQICVGRRFISSSLVLDTEEH